MKQRGPADCAVACLAMFLDVDYDEVYAVLPDDVVWRLKHGEGMQNTETADVAYKFGVILGHRQHVDPARKALVVVPSKNNPAPHKHMIYWDGKRVHDPSLKKRYAKLPLTALYALQEV